MDGLKELLSKAWLNGLFGLIGGLLGVLGVVLFLASRSRSRIAAQINSLELVGVKSVLPNEIEFLFRGTKVPKVTLSRIAIWNIGNTTLTGDQIVESDPLLIVTSDGSEILEVTVTRQTREVNQFSCVHLDGFDPNKARCYFDYLDPQDGALVQVIHTGTEKVEVVGTLRGIKKRILVKSVTKKDETKYSEAGAGSQHVGKFIGFVMFLGGLAFLLVALLNPPAHDPHETTLILFAGCAFIVMGIASYWLSSFMPPPPLSTQITTIDPKKQFLAGFLRAITSRNKSQ